ncbi:MAG TPA: non-canonical purine NTP pyrophosphatase, RdgB/HAM1 family, partial [Deinococcus radiodurans]|nr:non-canonical purine NTP pyrophosphatase, RdgB/HAM1 family [Deinococcus radiodurans]
VTLPEETGSTYEENAALKACAAAMATGLPALADDSGIEVLALGGQPGVYSARFGNVNSDVERNVLLLEKMRRHTDRRAKFVSVLVLAYPDGKLEEYRGEVTGQLLEGPRGESGFGYDPLFLPDGSELSMGEMTLEQKQAISHRGQALAALLAAHGA